MASDRSANHAVRQRRQSARSTAHAFEIADSARRYGVPDEDIRAAVSVPLRFVLQGEDCVLVIGADASGRLLEVVVLGVRPFTVRLSAPLCSGGELVKDLNDVLR